MNFMNFSFFQVKKFFDPVQSPSEVATEQAQKTPDQKNHEAIAQVKTLQPLPVEELKKPENQAILQNQIDASYEAQKARIDNRTNTLNQAKDLYNNPNVAPEIKKEIVKAFETHANGLTKTIDSAQNTMANADIVAS